MAPTPESEDELAGTEQPFVEHLMELRDRLLKAIIAVGVAAGVLFLIPGRANSTISSPRHWWPTCPRARR